MDERIDLADIAEMFPPYRVLKEWQEHWRVEIENAAENVPGSRWARDFSKLLTKAEHSLWMVYNRDIDDVINHQGFVCSKCAFVLAFDVPSLMMHEENTIIRMIGVRVMEIARETGNMMSKLEDCNTRSSMGELMLARYRHSLFYDIYTDAHNAASEVIGILNKGDNNAE
jgi:hypothetical protein